MCHPSCVQTGRRAVVLGDVLHAEVRRLDALADPVAAVVGVREALDVIDEGVTSLGKARLRRIAELRAAGWSYGRLMSATGMSKSRAAQLARQAAATTSGE
jgi:hypothetical protein